MTAEEHVELHKSSSETAWWPGLSVIWVKLQVPRGTSSTSVCVWYILVFNHPINPQKQSSGSSALLLLPQEEEGPGDEGVAAFQQAELVGPAVLLPWIGGLPSSWTTAVQRAGGWERGGTSSLMTKPESFSFWSLLTCTGEELRNCTGH